MRRSLAVALFAVVTALLPVTTPPPASAGAVIVGHLVLTGGNPVPDTTVRLHSDAAGAPGAVVDTETTNTAGEFTLSPTTDGLYWVEIVRNAHVQGGYVSDGTDGPSYVQFDISAAAPVPPGTRLGRVVDAASFVRGTVVNAANGNPVSGVLVSIRDVVDRATSLGSDTTDANGLFRIPAYGEEFGLYLRGAPRNFENGWRACNGTVVARWGPACSIGTGGLGRVRLDHL